MMKATKLIAILALVFGLAFGAIGVAAASETVTVEHGETYWELAQNFEGVTAEDLIEANQYHPQAIPVGATITVPTSDIVTHVVQPGNTLVQIASVYDGVTVDDLFRLNPDVDPYQLVIGSEVVVVDYSATNGDDYLYHIVQPGNTFNEIASVYDGVSVDDLIEANPNEDPEELTVGSRIIIPLD